MSQENLSEIAQDEDELESHADYSPAKDKERLQHFKSRLEFCLGLIRERLEERTLLPTPTDFTYKDANLYITFLEIISLQGLQGEYDQKLKFVDLMRRYVIGKENLALFRELRSNTFLHRKNNKEYVVYKLEDVKSTIDTGNDFTQFWNGIQKYMEQVIERLAIYEHYEATDPSELSSIVIAKDDLGIIELPNKNELDKDEAKSALFQLFDKFMRVAYEEKLELANSDELFFEYIVNLLPLLTNFYSARAHSKKGKKARNAIPENQLILHLEELRELRNAGVHGFTDGTVQHRNSDLLTQISELRSKFLKFYASQELLQTFQQLQANNETDSNKVDEELRQVLSRLRSVLGAKEYFHSKSHVQKENNFGFEVKELAYLKSDNLQEYAQKYFSYMVYIDNDQAIAERSSNFVKFAGDHPERFRKLGAAEKREIVELFEALRRKSSDPAYEQLKNDLRTKMEEFGILKNVFNSIVQSIIEAPGAGHGNWQPSNPDAIIALDHVKNALALIQQILNHHPISNEEVIKKFEKRASYTVLTSCEKKKALSTDQILLKFCEVPEYKCVDLMLESSSDPESSMTVKINPDQIVNDLLQMYNNTFIRYSLDFSSIEAIFQDEMVLSYLILEDLHYCDEHFDVLLHLPYTYPMLVMKITEPKKSVNQNPQGQLPQTEKPASKKKQRKTAKLTIPPSQILPPADFFKIVKELLKNESHIKFLIALLNCPESVENKFCCSLDDMFHGILECLLNDQFGKAEYPVGMRTFPKEHLLGLLKQLASDATFRKQRRYQSLLTNLVGSINFVCFELYKETKYVQTYNTLHGMIQEFPNGGGLDLEIIYAQRIMAKSKNFLKEFSAAKEIFIEIHLRLDPLFHAGGTISIDLGDTALKQFAHYLLNFSDLAYTNSLLGEHYIAYNLYRSLFLKITAISGINVKTDAITCKQFKKLGRSKNYVRLVSLELLGMNYISVLRVLSDMAYEKRALGTMNHLRDARKLYKNVYNIRQTTLDVDHLQTMQSLREFEHMQVILGDKYKGQGSFLEANESYLAAEANLLKLLTIQETKYGKYHQAVSSIRTKYLEVQGDVAFTANKLGASIRDDKAKARKYYKMALAKYNEILEIDPKSSRTLKAIEYTKSQLAKLK